MFLCIEMKNITVVTYGVSYGLVRHINILLININSIY